MVVEKLYTGDEMRKSSQSVVNIESAGRADTPSFPCMSPNDHGVTSGYTRAEPELHPGVVYVGVPSKSRVDDEAEIADEWRR